MSIYLIRHAQSAFNAVYGPNKPDPMIFDAPITELGETQAKQARREVEKLDSGNLCSSGNIGAKVHCGVKSERCSWQLGVSRLGGSEELIFGKSVFSSLLLMPGGKPANSSYVQRNQKFPTDRLFNEYSLPYYGPQLWGSCCQQCVRRVSARGKGAVSQFIGLHGARCRRSIFDPLGALGQIRESGILSGYTELGDVRDEFQRNPIRPNLSRI